ncbi:hypothetical protein BGX23_012429 [Mortierella sp. AD031]|nr:hypothetical protein BGX23_012429 [Mortierella sp. AD031]KAG0203412.1 hypothetical protein BGX33_009135 [Mortierella sp. NVP41]
MISRPPSALILLNLSSLLLLTGPTSFASAEDPLRVTSSTESFESSSPSTDRLGRPSRPTPMAVAPVYDIASNSEPHKKTVSGWPISLKIEIDELELGGVAIPLVQNLFQNSQTASKNFGNIDLASP